MGVALGRQKQGFRAVEGSRGFSYRYVTKSVALGAGKLAWPRRRRQALGWESGLYQRPEACLEVRLLSKLTCLSGNSGCDSSHDRVGREPVLGIKINVYDRGTNSARQTATRPFPETYRGKDRIAQVLRVSGRERAHRTLARNPREVRLGSRRTAPSALS